MGPRTYIRGKERNGAPHAGTSWLQWGRGLTSAERLELSSWAPWRLLRFNGAADLHPRKEPRGRADNPPHDKLQWGRGLTSAERKVGTAKPLRGRAASMGPRTYIRGKAPDPRQDRNIWLASMGPRTYIRGKSPPSGISRRNSLLQWGRGLTSAERLATE